MRLRVSLASRYRERTSLSSVVTLLRAAQNIAPPKGLPPALDVVDVTDA